MNADSILHTALAGFASALKPLEDSVATPDALAHFVGGFGWSLTPADSDRVSNSLSGISVPADPSALTTDQLVSQIAGIATAIRSISGSGAPAAFANTFPGDVLDYLIHSALAANGPKLFSLLHFFGVLTERQVPADSATGRGDYVAREVHWDRLSTLGGQPADALQQAYGWGADFRADDLLRSIGIVIQAFGGHAAMFAANRDLVDEYWAAGAAPPSGLNNLIVSLPHMTDDVLGDGSAMSTSIALLGIPIPPTATSAAPADGLALMPVITGQATDTIPITDQVSLTISGDVLSRPVRAELHPGSSALRATPGDTHITSRARVDAKSAPATPWLAFGDATSTRLEVAVAHASLDLDGILDGELELVAEVGLDAATLVIDLGGSDSFVGSIMGSQPVKTPITLGLRWSSKTGLSLAGQSRLAISIPVSQAIGPITVTNVGLELGSESGAMTFAATVSASGTLGPFTVTIANVGLSVKVAPVPNAAPVGNLGSANAAIGFKAPSGVGLAIDVAGLVGGGFLDRDDVKKEYGGVLQLEFLSYKLSAFGLLATVLPTGPGYSLIAMVDAQFPPIQLGLGFSLAGAGGLLGVHRTASVDALRAGLAAHTLSNLLFPKNPIANAPQLLTELDTMFPAAAGRFLFGPLLRIDWGTPALVTIDLALMLELPEPVRVVLIAEIAVLLPTPTDKLVELHVSALGTIDFGANEGALDAVLHNSRLMKFALHGGMALRVNWSSQKAFLLSVGGFHPKFQSPPGFPKLDRVGISMATGSIAKLNLDGYFAISSNSLQLGAAIDLAVGVDGFGIAGNLGFDTLIQRHPFHFNGDISGSVALSVDGHHLMALSMSGALTGPAPWNANGSVSFEVLWWSVTKSFSEVFGESGDAPAPAQVDVGQLLRTALADARNFSSVVGADVRELVTLQLPMAADTVVVLRPGAALSVHQTVVPLGLAITQYAGAAPIGESRFDISSVCANGSAQAFESVMDDFAPAQFLALSDDDKLASPSFERFASGASLTGDTTFGQASARVVVYETWLADTPDSPLREDVGLPTPLPVGVFAGWLLDGSAGRSALVREGAARYAGPRHDMMPAALAFAVASSDTLTTLGVADVAGQTYRQAHDALAAQVARHPDQAGALVVVAQYEVAA